MIVRNKQTFLNLPFVDFSDSDEDFSDSETMVRSPPKKPKKNNTGPKYAVDDLSDDNNAILTPVIRASDTTTMPPAPQIMVSTNFCKTSVIQRNDVVQGKFQQEK